MYAEAVDVDGERVSCSVAGRSGILAAMSNGAERARRRRGSWRGAVVPAGAPKPPLYADMSPEQRLMALAALNARVWEAAGLLPLPPLERAQWPGAIVEPVAND